MDYMFPVHVLWWEHWSINSHWPVIVPLGQGLICVCWYLSFCQWIIVITRVNEVIMFSPCVFVTLFVCLFDCLCLYHDVCPDDLTMKDWCHTNNILQVHCWGCLVVQVMFHALMTSSMTSPGHKVGQILKVIYLRHDLSWSVDQKLKMSEMLMAIFLVYPTSGITSDKKFVASSKQRPFWQNLKY